MQLEAALHHNFLVRVAHSVVNAHLVDNESFEVGIDLDWY